MENTRLSLQVSYLTSIQEDIHQVETLMRSQASGKHPDLAAALDLLISAGGKRIRPALTVLAGKMLGADHLRLVTLAAAIELLHTATLVHDDLIDGSLLRRGMPTLNSQWSPGATILTGDFLFASAAKLAAETNSIPVMSLFSNTLTVIVNGEISQLFSSRCKVSREDYFQRIYAKTASLFETASQSAALISEAGPVIENALRIFGHEIGMAFQIMDDILDFTADPALLGKPVGSDLRQGLVTLPTILYIDNHPEDKNTNFLVEGNCTHRESVLETLINNIRTSEAPEQARQAACQYINRGLDHLLEIQPSEHRDELEQLAKYIVDRPA